MLSVLTVLGLAAFLSAAEPPSFDVASVKANSAPTDYIESGKAERGTVTLHNANMSDCIRYAWRLASADQVVGPGWMSDYAVKFDIVAKAPAETPEPTLLLMLQHLLIERFHLELHHESRPLPHYVLEAGKGGLKLPASAEGASIRYVLYRTRFDFTHADMPGVAEMLSRQLRQPVIDRTAARGFYDVKLEWSADDKGPDLPDALAGVGLKLTASKEPMEVVVVTRADRVPAAN
jgi:uncharacterized protein (TIGR03435 family)